MLSGKVAVVTGAGNGIGAEIAKLMAKHGAKVVVNDAGVSASGEGRDPAVARAVVEQIAAGGGQAVASVRNVADWDDAHGIINDAIDAFGRVDVVVNNAGILRDGLFHKMSRQDFDTVDDVNLRGVFYVSRAAAPHFKEQQSGCYVHMTSTSGLIGNLGQVNYGAAKLAVAGLSKLIAMDMERFGVTSNAIAPFAWTRMVATIPATPGEHEAPRGQSAAQARADRAACRRARERSAAARRLVRSSACATTRSICSASRVRFEPRIRRRDGLRRRSSSGCCPSFQASYFPARQIE